MNIQYKSVLMLVIFIVSILVVFYFLWWKNKWKHSVVVSKFCVDFHIDSHVGSRRAVLWFVFGRTSFTQNSSGYTSVFFFLMLTFRVKFNYTRIQIPCFGKKGTLIGTSIFLEFWSIPPNIETHTISLNKKDTFLYLGIYTCKSS